MVGHTLSGNARRMACDGDKAACRERVLISSPRVVGRVRHRYPGRDKGHETVVRLLVERR